MRVAVAGATGVIGRPLVQRLQQDGHEVAALARSAERAQTLRARGVEPYVVDVFDQSAVTQALADARPEVVVAQLTALPRNLDLRQYRTALAPTNRLRREATPHLVAGARAASARRIVVQSISFITAPVGPPIHDEDAPTFDDAPPALRDAVLAATEMERATLGVSELEPVVLRYGFFYGPGTQYAPDGGSAAEIRRRRFPIAGGGTGIHSFLHIDDAVDATVTALSGGRPGLYNVTDDDPAPMGEWVPAAARALGAKPPLRVPAWLARLLVGPHAVHFATTLRGNSNGRFKQTFSWEPTWPSWRQGLPEALTGP